MKRVLSLPPRVPKIALLLVAGIVWGFAGVKILSIGIPDMVSTWVWPALNLAAAAAVFLLFFFLIFRRMVRKHRGRIMGYDPEKVFLLAFFDWKGYLIMGFMMTFGIVLRGLQVVPPLYLGTFYTGLGSSLAGAGACFLLAFVKELMARRKPFAHM